MHELLICSITKEAKTILVDEYAYEVWREGQSIFISPCNYNSACIYGTVTAETLCLSAWMEPLIPRLESKILNNSHFIEIMLIEKTICTTTPLKGVFSTLCCAINEIDITSSEILSFKPMQDRFGACTSKLSRKLFMSQISDILYDQLKIQDSSPSNESVGLFGGAGVDSSILLGLLKKQKRNVNFFTFGYDENFISVPDVCELRKSRRVASYYGVEHDVFRFTPWDIWSVTARFGRHELSATRLHYSHIEKYYSDVRRSLPGTNFYNGFYADTLLNPKRILDRFASNCAFGWSEPWHELLFLDCTQNEVSEIKEKLLERFRFTISCFRDSGDQYDQCNLGFFLENNSSTNFSSYQKYRFNSPFGADEFVKLVMGNATLDDLTDKALLKDAFYPECFPDPFHWKKGAQGTPFTSYFDYYLREQITATFNRFGLPSALIERIYSHPLRFKIIPILFYRLNFEAYIS